MSVATPDAKRRVKLYALNASRQWDDKGTGHVTSCYHEPLDGMSLLVRNEADGSLLLESKIQLDTQYQKQQGTLIVWTESDNYDLALSFQEKEGCNEIWENICRTQGRDPNYEQDPDDEQEEIRINLIDCDADKLQQILEQINAFSQTTRRRDVLATEYIEHDYINKLLHIFKQADEKQDLPILYKLYEVFKQLFLYDRTTLTEVMLNESILMDVIGVFEYETPIERQQQSQENPATTSEQQTQPEQQQQQLSQETSQDQEKQQQDRQGEEEAAAAAAADVKPPESETTLEVEPEPQETGPEEPAPQQQQQQQEKEDDQIDLDLKSDAELQADEQPQPQPQPQPQQQPQQQQQQQPAATKPESQQPEQKEHQTKSQPAPVTRKKHREFLTSGTKFKEVIPFSNQQLVDKIHQTYRVQYLQSSVLPAPSILEENAYNALTNILFFYKVEIVSMIQENEEFLQNLFNQIISNETGTERKRELVLFLREYCIFSQTIQPKQRESFFKTLASLKILSAVEVALSSNDQVTKSAAIDIFTYIVEYNPHMTREHAVQQRDGTVEPPNGNIQNTNMLKLVIEHITTDQDPELGTATQLSCIIKLLLDPDTMSGDAMEKQLFLEFFYYTCMQSLVEPINNATTPEGDIKPSANDRRTAHLLSIMLELLTFFMEHHFIHMRTYISSRDLLTRIISLIKSRHKFLVLSVIRFFRRLLASKDDYYYNLVMSNDLFSPIIQVLKNNNGRYNLLDSAILEMFEFIQHENLLPLIDHVLTNFGPFLESIDYVSTFKVMREKQEGIHESMDKPQDTHRLTPIEDSQTYFGNHSRMDLAWNLAGTDVEGEVRTSIRPNAGNDEDNYSLEELDFRMNGNKTEGEEVDEEVEDDEVEDEDDDIRMDEEDCDDELEPQFKKKKTK